MSESSTASSSVSDALPLCQYEDARNAGNDGPRTLALLSLFSIPRLALPLVRGGRRHQRHRLDRIRAQMAAAAAVLAAVAADAAALDDPVRPRDNGPDNRERRLATSVRRLVEQGYLGRASALLRNNSSVPAMIDAVVGELRRLHPPGAPVDVLPALPAVLPPRVILLPADVAKVASSFDNGSAPGGVPVGRPSLSKFLP